MYSSYDGDLLEGDLGLLLEGWGFGLVWLVMYRIDF